MNDGRCTPVVEERLSAAEAEEKANNFKALADPIRLRLLSLIASAPQGEICACDLPDPLERSQPTVSHHLSVLVEAGMITREQRGKWAWFAVARDRAEFIQAVLSDQAELTVS